VGGLDVTMSFTLQGGPELQRRLHAIGGTPKVILGNLGIRAVREAKLIVPRRTGNLGRTIRVGAHTSEFVEVRAGGALKVGYAAYVEYGTGAHDIIPRQRKALAWGGERTLGGRLRAGSRATHFAKRVHHPGTKPHPFLVPGLMLALKAIGLDDMVKRWNGAA
jgi:hypothetical protein